MDLIIAFHRDMKKRWYDSAGRKRGTENGTNEQTMTDLSRPAEWHNQTTGGTQRGFCE